MNIRLQLLTLKGRRPKIARDERPPGLWFLKTLEHTITQLYDLRFIVWIVLHEAVEEIFVFEGMVTSDVIEELQKSVTGV